LPELPENHSLLSNLALNYYFDNKPEQALTFARKTAAADPQNTSAWLMISELELQKGNLEAGQEALAKVPAERITSPEPYLNLGILFYNKKKLAEADDAFTKAIAKKPDLASAYYYRGLERYQAKRLADAKADLQKSIELEPSGKDAETAKELLKTMK
jgi:tetratricopeptide (TPR) repeat protein